MLWADEIFRVRPSNNLYVKHWISQNFEINIILNFACKLSLKVILNELYTLLFAVRINWKLFLKTHYLVSLNFRIRWILHKRRQCVWVHSVIINHNVSNLKIYCITITCFTHCNVKLFKFCRKDRVWVILWVQKSNIKHC